MASNSPGNYYKTHHVMETANDGGFFPAQGARSNFHLGGANSMQRDASFGPKDSGYYVNTSDGASTCSSSTTEAGDGEAGTLLVLEPKSLRSFTTNDEYLYAMTEDLADWFACLYQNDEITAENFFQVLETGVLLCKHANKVQEFARQRREKGETLEMRSYFIRSVPEGNVSYKEDVKPGTFKARDNVSNFISWCRQLGIPEVLRFETDDLVLRKNEKSVILCLLEMARVGAKLGMLAPTLVQMEQEIDAELAGEEPKPKVQIKTCDMRSLDERVRDLIGRCTCPVQFPMVKVGEGKYKIGDSQNLIFVRILRNHVMVRVGGGWDTLENYLNKHDPCQCNYRGHRAGSANPVTHKVISVNQQRRSSTPGNAVAVAAAAAATAPRPVPSTPTSPRRMSTTMASPARNRSASPQTQHSTRSKSPTLVISRHLPVPSKTNSSGPAPGTKGSRVTPSQNQSGVVSQAWSQPAFNSSSNCTSASNQQPARCKSPSPGRLRSPSPLTVSQSTATRPSVLRTSSSSALLKGKEAGPDSRSSTPRKTGPGSFCSDYDEDAALDNDGYFAEDDEFVEDEASDAGSVSFDERAEFPSALRSARSASPSSERVTDMGGVEDMARGDAGQANVTMDKISTMTLTEFKSLLNSALSVPEDEQQVQGGHGGGRSPGQSHTTNTDPAGRPLNWDSLREKARSVRDSISSSVSSRRGPGTAIGGSGTVGRRSLPESPDEDRGRPSSAMERPKTPKALRRNVEAPSSPVISRPKTPTSLSRPKTPTSSYACRPKTPSGPKEEYQMVRSKTPSQLKRDAVAKVAGAISNWVESRNEMDAGRAPPARAKTPTRSKTPVGFRSGVQNSIDECDNEDDECMEVTSALSNPQVQALATSIRERPSTPSRIPKPCFTPRPSTPKLPSGLATDLPVDDACPSDFPLQQRPTRPTTLSAHRPHVLSRSNSNSSSVRSCEETPSSPVSNCSEDRPFPKVSRKLSYQSNASDTSLASSGGRSYRDMYAAKRAGSEVRQMPARAVTPGPREKWTIGGAIGESGVKQHKGPAAQRRGSLNTTCQIEKPSVVKHKKTPGMQLRRTSSTSNLEPDPQMTITNEITFSDDEEINELVKNAALQAMTSQSEERPRAASVDARKLKRQTAKERDEEVLMVRRDRSGTHGVQVVRNNEVKYESTPRPNVVRRPPSRGSSVDRPVPSTAAATNRFRSQTPDPSMFRQKISSAKDSSEAESVSGAGKKSVNRTEAWVDSTLSDPKRKLPPRPKRTKGYANEIPTSELVPRSLEEIKAMLTEPVNGFNPLDSGTLDPPAEDPEMFKKMEKLFEKYREMELRASVNDTPGAGGGPTTADKAADAQSSRGDSQGSGRAKSSVSGASQKTSSGSGVSSTGRVPGRTNGSVTARAASNEDNRFRRSSSVPGSFQNPQLNPSSNNSSAVSSPYQEVKSFPQSTNTFDNGQCFQDRQNSGESQAGQKGPGSLRDIDPEVTKDPAALISKIKEILKVRPRKDENTKIPTRIPAPAGLNRNGRSKSVSNLYGDINVQPSSDRCSGNSTARSGGQAVLQQADNYQDNAYNNNLRRTSSSSSGNIAYSEFVYTDDGTDEVPELTRAWSVQSDSSDSQNRSETPIPKLATPLTTGRSTLISRRGDRMGRSLSQDKENNLSNSQSSLSSRSVLSATEDDSEFV